MKKTLKIIALLSILILSVLMIAACSSDDAYKKIQNDGYTVSVKYDIGDGTFSDRDLVLVDAFNLNNEKTNADGMKEISLISPDSELRKGEKLEMAYQGHTFIGWYKTRTEVKNDDGTTSYKYSDMWDFSKDKLVLDPKKDYSSDTPVMTLYAAWAELTNFEIYCKGENGSFELKQTITAEALTLPKWVERTGKLSTTNFPTFEGKTFSAAYLDEQCTVPAPEQIESDIDYETGTLKTQTVKIYTTLLDGTWYRIYNAKSMVSINDANANYIICADLDFSETAWSQTNFATGVFNGTICTDGEIYKLSNINATYQAKSQTGDNYGGIFKELGSNSRIENIILENVSFTFNGAVNGFKNNTVSIGLLAGKVNSDAVVQNISFAGKNTINVDYINVSVGTDKTVDKIIIVNSIAGIGQNYIDSTISADSIEIVEQNKPNLKP